MSIPRLRAALLFLLLLGGCASAPYGVHYADEYGGAEYYYDSSTPTYIAYPAYYNALWPLYSQWYDPFFAPGFYYGVTFFPSYYNHWGWGGWGGWLSWSPWRSAWWDNYHDWYYWSLRSPAWYAQRQHLGSARNQQVARAALAGQPRRGVDIQHTSRNVGASSRASATRSALPSSRYSPQSRGQTAPPRGSRAVSRPAPASAGARGRSDIPMRAAPAPRPAQPRPARSQPAPARSAPPPVSRPARTTRATTAPARAGRPATSSRRGR